MSEETAGSVVSVSETGRATIPEELREKHGIDTPGTVRITENEEGEIVIETVERLSELRGIVGDEGEYTGTKLLREGRETDGRREE